MKEVLSFLQECSTFYVATVDGDKPKVRPFGLVMEADGKLYFFTTNQKAIYKQLSSNSFIEISTTSEKMEWMRLSGKAVFHKTPELVEQFFKAAPFLKDAFKSADNPIIELFYIDEVVAEFCTMGSAPRTVKL